MGNYCNWSEAQDAHLETDYGEKNFTYSIDDMMVAAQAGKVIQSVKTLECENKPGSRPGI